MEYILTHLYIPIFLWLIVLLNINILFVIFSNYIFNIRRWE